MKSKKYIQLFAVLCGMVVLVYCTENKPTVAAPSPESEADLVKRGEYLVGIMGCGDCHSPKKLGPQGPEVIPELHLSGYPSDRPLGKIIPEAIQNGWMLFGPDGTSAVGPWGVSFAANLTSDESGIGNWSLEQFKKALTQGKSKGLDNGRALLPPMPWFNYVAMKQEDIEAVFKYLKSTKPVRNVVPTAIPPAVN